MISGSRAVCWSGGNRYRYTTVTRMLVQVWKKSTTIGIFGQIISDRRGITLTDVADGHNHRIIHSLWIRMGLAMGKRRLRIWERVASSCIPNKHTWDSCFGAYSLLRPSRIQRPSLSSAVAAGLRVSDARLQEVQAPIAMNVVSTCYSLSNLYQHYRLQKCAFLRFIRFVLIF